MLKFLFERRFLVVPIFFISICFNSQIVAQGVAVTSEQKADKKLVYIVSDTRIPFWRIMGKGIQSSAESLGYKLDILSANNDTKRELEHVVKSIQENVSGIIISPTTSSASVMILKLAKRANIPVVISDIGTDSGDYVSFISSDNKQGAYSLGKILVKRLSQLGWEEGSVGVIAIPQKRANGQARTSGFMQALNEAGVKASSMLQQVTFSYQETYDFSTRLIHSDPNLRAIWLQGSDRYQAALDAIDDSGMKHNILLISFDAEPIFLELIPREVLVGAAMQQPYLMGQKAARAMDDYLAGEEVVKNYKVPILAISNKNIAQQLDTIKKNVLGLDSRVLGDHVKN